MLVANTPPNHAVYMGINAKLLPCKRIASGVIFLCTMLLLGGMASNGVRAQDEATDENEAIKAAANVYAEEPVDQNQKKNMAAIGAILRAGKFENAGQQNDLDTYFKTYALARWTQAMLWANRWLTIGRTCSTIFDRPKAARFTTVSTTL